MMIPFCLAILLVTNCASAFKVDTEASSSTTLQAGYNLTMSFTLEVTKDDPQDYLLQWIYKTCMDPKQQIATKDKLSPSYRRTGRYTVSSKTISPNVTRYKLFIRDMRLSESGHYGIAYGPEGSSMNDGMRSITIPFSPIAYVDKVLFKITYDKSEILAEGQKLHLRSGTKIQLSCSA